MSFIDGITNAGALPALEATIRFAGARQRLIASDIANIDTPDYRTRDVDPKDFQRALGEAIDRRRSRGWVGSLGAWDSGEVRFDRNGAVELNPGSGRGNVLFHDRNNRDLERLMQDLAENVGVYRIAADLLKHRMDTIEGAIRETT